jgi:hypothetical protein
MTDQPPPIKDTTARDMAVRTQALEMAIRSNCGKCYTEEGQETFDYRYIVEAALAFESFIKGINKPDVKKENW